MLFDELVLVRLDLRIAALHLQILFGVPVADEGDPHDSETVRSHVGELRRDVHVHAIDKGRYGNERARGQNNPEQSQKTAQFALAQGIDRDPGRFPEGCAWAKVSSSHVLSLIYSSTFTKVQTFQLS